MQTTNLGDPSYVANAIIMSFTDKSAEIYKMSSATMQKTTASTEYNVSRTYKGRSKEGNTEHAKHKQTRLIGMPRRVSLVSESNGARLKHGGPCLAQLIGGLRSRAAGWIVTSHDSSANRPFVCPFRLLFSSTAPSSSSSSSSSPPPPSYTHAPFTIFKSLFIETSKNHSLVYRIRSISEPHYTTSPRSLHSSPHALYAPRTTSTHNCNATLYRYLDGLPPLSTILHHTNPTTLQ